MFWSRIRVTRERTVDSETPSLSAMEENVARPSSLRCSTILRFNPSRITEFSLDLPGASVVRERANVKSRIPAIRELLGALLVTVIQFQPLGRKRKTNIGI